MTERRLNADFSRRVVVGQEDHDWVASPVPGVTRMMLDRIGEEVARATSLVRYAPNSTFPRHAHGGGEEILVLRGEFADEHGRYPVGSYLRNPVGTSHTPSVGPAGAEIFVKLRQFDPQDQRLLALDTSEAAWLAGSTEGVRIMPLHRFGTERIALWRWAPGAWLASRTYSAGAELLVIEGGFEDEEGHYDVGTWLRLPAGATHAPSAGPEGALVYAKTGHLSQPPELSVEGA